MGVFKFFFYPLYRAHRDVTRCSATVKKALATAKEGVCGTNGRAPVEGEHAAQEILPTDSHERFEFLAANNKFDENMLREQKHAVQMGKRIAVRALAVLLISAVFTIVLAKGMVAVMSLPITLSGCLFFGVQTLRYGLFQAQLEDRRLYSFREFLGRPDLFSFLLGS